jgi:hypothetical protein
MEPEQLLAKKAAARPSVTRTIRIDEEVDQALGRLSDRQRVSVNQLVNSALRRYTEWELLADMIGMIDIHDKTVGKLFEGISEDKAREIGCDTGLNAWTEMVAFMFKTVNYSSILKMLELRARYGHWFIFERTRQKDMDVLILKHSQGKKVTAFFAEAMKCLLGRVGMRFEIDESEDQILVKIHPEEKSTRLEPWPIVGGGSRTNSGRINYMSEQKKSG